MNTIARLATSAFAFGLVIAPAFSQDLGVKAPPQSQAVIISNATIHTVSDGDVEKGWIAFDRGRITAMGQASPPSTGARIIDASGLHVYPSLIASYTHLGLTEVAAVRSTLDMGEIGVGTPEVRACVAVNPDSTLIPVARSNGVLVAGVFPRTDFRGTLAYFSGPGGVFPGRASVMRLDGWTWEDMTVRDDAGLVINWPYPRPVESWWQRKSREDQQKEIDEALRVIDELFTSARAYLDAKAANPSMASDLRFEGMRGVLPLGPNDKSNGRVQLPVYVQANDYDAIQQSVTLLGKHGLRVVIVGGLDAPQCADLLKRHNASVIVDGTYKFPKRDDSAYNEGFTLPARLEAAGIPWALSSGEETANERNLPYAAALAVAHGLNKDAALRAITLNAARVLNVEDSLGSLSAGKSATLFIADGDILEVTTNVRHAFIDGREIDLTDKQKTLDAKYREKYRQAGQPSNASPGAGSAGPSGSAR